MVADSSFSPTRPPAWYVATDQGVVLAGPFPEQATAWAARRTVLANLRADLMRDRRPGWFVAQQLRAVRVCFGTLVGPWRQLRPMDPDGRD